jgi:NADPH-dependent glutamate synthase beta subunit-like oxidoreductase
MPAIEREIEEALEEGIKIDFLAAPIRVLRDDSGKMTKMVVQRMELGEPDDSGRRRPVPIDGDVYEMEADTLIMAVSQQPDWSTLGSLVEKGSWLETDEWGHTNLEGVWSGGDALRLGLATISIGQGRKAAESIHADLRGIEPLEDDHRPTIGKDRIRLDWYDPQKAVEREILSPEERLANPYVEIDKGVSLEAAVQEASRCFSCGKCFGCDNCWMYCQNSCFTRAQQKDLGHYFDLNVGLCDGCKKCAEECPCGFLDLI